MKTPNLNSGQMITIAYGVGILIVLFIVYKFLQKIGLVKSSAKIKEEQAENKAVQSIRTAEYFDPMYLKGNRTYKPLGKTAQFYAAQLRDATSGLGTDEEAIFSVFGKLKNKENIAEVSAYYFQDYNRLLQNDVLNELNDSDKLILYSIIDKLPNK